MWSKVWVNFMVYMGATDFFFLRPSSAPGAERQFKDVSKYEMLAPVRCQFLSIVEKNSGRLRN